MNYLDLFSGIGGFHLGLEMAGFKFDWVGYSEIDDYANKVYTKNFPGVVPLADITKIKPEDLLGIDLVTGGFPCQDISVAGKQEGINAKRSGLFYEIIRLCGVVRPKIIFLENVSNLLNGNGGEWMRAVLTALAEIGYNAEWEIIRASDVGAPHRRARVWIVAYPRDCSDRANRRPEREKESVQSRRRATRCSGMSRRTSSSSGNVADADKHGLLQSLPLGRDKETKRGKKTIRGTYRNEVGAGYPDNIGIGKDKTRGGTSWSIEPHVGRVAHGIPFRVDRLKCLGNAVVPQCVELVGRLILESGLLGER